MDGRSARMVPKRTLNDAREWVNDISKMCEIRWMRIDQNGNEWKRVGNAFIQKTMMMMYIVF